MIKWLTEISPTSPLYLPYISPRMIKWLTEISVTTEESSNHFHYMDNRVLPEFVDAERATAEGW